MSESKARRDRVVAEYRRWATLQERLEDETATATERDEAQTLALDNPLCRREHDLLTSFRQASTAPGEAERALVERTLERLRRSHAVVALRPGTAPPALGSTSARSPRRSWVLAGGSFAAAALVAYFAWNTSEPPPSAAPTAPGSVSRGMGQLALVSGQVRVNGAVQRLPGATLHGGEHVEVVFGRACLALDRGVVACLDAQTEVVLQGAADAELSVVVERGRAVAKLDKQPAGQGFALVGERTRAHATGTSFALAKDPAKPLRVDVLEGTVRLTDPSTAIDLGAGERWEAGVGRSVVTRETAEWYRALLTGSAALNLSLARAGSEVAVLQVESEPEGARVELDGSPVGQTPLAVLVPKDPEGASHSLWLGLAEHESERRSLDFATAGVHRLFFELEPTPRAVAADASTKPATERLRERPSADEKGETPSEDPRALLSEARQLVAERRWSDAAQSYRRLKATFPKSAEARTVSVALGQLELDRLGQPAAARRSFQSYLDLGGGALSQEARYGKVRAARALGDDAAELAAIREYLRAHPNGVNAPALARRARELGAE